MNDHNLILLRGVSGSGKSTIAELFVDAVIMSTDEYFMVDGVYIFDGSKLSEYHKANQERVGRVMADVDRNLNSKCTIVVHNTFTAEWEMQPYYKLAKEYLFAVHTLIAENRHQSNSIHDVPQSTIDAQRERFEVTL